VLADLSKTASDFKALTTKALDQLCGGVMPRLRQVATLLKYCLYLLVYARSISFSTDYRIVAKWMCLRFARCWRQ
jgi:hypothetical protein